MENKKPSIKYRAGTVTATVWKNENKEGKTFFSVDIVRNYTTEENDTVKWHKSSSFNTKDLADVMIVTRKVQEYIRLKEE